MRHFIRLITSVLTLLLISVFIPGFIVHHLQTAFFIGIIISLIGWVIESCLQGEISPFARAVIGVIITTVVLTLFSLTPFVSINALGMIIAALIIGTVDLFIPTYARHTK